MSSDNSEQAEALPLAEGETPRVAPAEPALHAEPAEAVELTPESASLAGIAPEVASDVAQPAYAPEPAAEMADAAAVEAPAANDADFETDRAVIALGRTLMLAAQAAPEAETDQAVKALGETMTFAAAAQPARPAIAAAPAAPAATPAEEDHVDGGKPKDDWLEITKTVAYALLIALVLRSFLFQPFTIPSASMEPNLYEGDYLVVSKWDYGFSKYSFPLSGIVPITGRVLDHAAKRGDIIVFKLPSDNKTDYIKRIIGVPGDQIQMRDGLLYINNEPVKDVKTKDVQALWGSPFPTQHNAQLVRETLPAGGKTFMTQEILPNPEDGDQVTRLDSTRVYTVPAGYYFAMGDNRRNSSDSRVPPDVGGVGFIPEANIEGKAQAVLFSWYPGASLWKPWTWFTKIRPSRFFMPLT